MKSEHGSAIVYVFIGIALFGALMFMFSRGSSNKNDIYDKNSEKLVVDEFLSYGNYMETEISKLLMDGCGERDLSFYHPNFWGPHNYAGAAKYGVSPDNKCSVFDPKGGGAKWRSPPKKVYDSGIYDYLFTGIMGVRDIGQNNCANTELMMFLQVPRATCLAANDQLKNINTGGNPPVFNSGHIYEDIGSGKRSAINYLHFGWGNLYFGCGATIGTGPEPDASELTAKVAGCYQAQNTEHYYLYRVLMAR